MVTNFGEYLKELSSQSSTAPIKSDGGEPAYSYGNITDTLGSKYNFVVHPKELKEFEEKVLKKDRTHKKNDDYFVKRFVEFKRNKLRLTPPFQDDLVMNNDFYARSFYDDMDRENDEHNEKIINEDGVACASAGNVGGMGAVVTSQPSSIPGNTSGATTGSGDIGVGLGTNRNVIKRPDSRRKKKLKSMIGKNFSNQFKDGDYKKGGDKNAHIMGFSEFAAK